MTTLYRPVLIESAEQAEALAERTVATHPDHLPREKFQNFWEDCDEDRDHSAMVGWTALVPIEAEEETDTLDYMYGKGPSVRRLVTPWEEQS